MGNMPTGEDFCGGGREYSSRRTEIILGIVIYV